MVACAFRYGASFSPHLHAPKARNLLGQGQEPEDVSAVQGRVREDLRDPKSLSGSGGEEANEEPHEEGPPHIPHCAIFKPHGPMTQLFWSNT